MSLDVHADGTISKGDLRVANAIDSTNVNCDLVGIVVANLIDSSVRIGRSGLDTVVLDVLESTGNPSTTATVAFLHTVNELLLREDDFASRILNCIASL